MERVRGYLLQAMVLLFASVWSLETTASTVFILVHGTWAHHSAWHKPEGDFFCALEDSVIRSDAHIISFCWDSKNTHEARVKAAQRLERVVLSYSPDTTICVIAHSHGANVANITSQLLADREGQKQRIQAFYLLGVPVCMTRYAPNMDVVRHIYNFFSFRDLVQPVLGRFGREYPGHNRIVNLRVTINGFQPTHFLIHDPELARWIPLIHEELVAKGEYGFDAFRFGVPGVMYFVKGQPVRYEQDMLRVDLARQDSKNIHASRALFVRCAASKLSLGWRKRMRGDRLPMSV